MYLRRKVDDFLQKWRKRQGHKPLMLKGARQVGKTRSIEHFAKENYKQVVSINFVEEPQYRTICANGYSPEAIIRNITRIDPRKFSQSRPTLLFFDEVQAYPTLTTALKFFAQEAHYDVICSGSLLGLNYQAVESNSVGYKEDYVMHSMDFEEFLWSQGYTEAISQELLGAMLAREPLGSVLLTTLNELYLNYCVTGGMPEVVGQYVAQGNFSGTLALQRQLLLDYEEDARKYATGLDQSRIINVFRHIPVQLAKDNKKFQLSQVAKGARFRDYRGCIEWLVDAGIINICYCLNFPELPLRGNYDEGKFKVYMRDTGLLVAMLDEEAQEDLRANRNLGVYKGALYENMVADALVKAGAELYYYKRDDSTLEEDFFLRTSEHLVPVEVKAHNGRAKSLRTLISSDKYADISWGIKLALSDIGEREGVRTFPYFCAYLLKAYLREARVEGK